LYVQLKAIPDETRRSLIWPMRAAMGVVVLISAAMIIVAK
jgi:hypothetical protein